jgi:hypothetical protein
MSDAIVNKVSESGLITLDLEQYYPREEVVLFDLKDYLFMGLILKEKDFREALKSLDWELYRNKYVGVTCSADAIIPPWAYMLAAAYLQPVAKDVIMGDEKEVHKTIFLQNIQGIDVNEFTGQRVVVKGCGETPIGEFAYMEITKRLRPVTKTIMYGEPCSTVPIYKKQAPAPKGE